MNDKKHPGPPAIEIEEPAGLSCRFPELAEIQREIELRIRDNQRFLERFLDEDNTDEEEEDPGEEEETLEEL